MVTSGRHDPQLQVWDIGEDSSGIPFDYFNLPYYSILIILYLFDIRNIKKNVYFFLIVELGLIYLSFYLSIVK